ncbi:Predicted arabinose efflux permease, MFS family [Kushneria avicenniae]|uniref:Predicted arabinose efflux permease, MFS family n=1 Tax=Kushneria avicenniae TaxID=402385 RepID=A0A1I1LN76_9GAMM|nr:MFS transporter [Kushneria avicenniae]SFC74435.1 Predicted arabinose efflux permease, MFS family [Kushneria avicenniae]
MSRDVTAPDVARPRQLVFYTLVLMAFLAASGVPTPLYPLYQESWHFSAFMLTLVFASYLFALLVTLLFTGALSDYLGRRPVILAGLVIELASMGCFLLATDLAWLFAARLLQGLATGIVTSALSAALMDSDHQRGPIMASVAPMIGMGLGALGASVLVAGAPWPLRLVYVVMIVIFAWQMLGLGRMKESVTRRPGALASMTPRARVPAVVLPTFVRTMPANVAAWALGGFSLSLGPALAEQVAGFHSALMGGLLACILSVMGGISVWRFRRFTTRTILLISSTLLPTGLVLVLISVYLPSLVLLITGYGVAGLGFGSGFMGALRAVMPLAPASERSSLMAVFYVVSYLSASLPALAAGIATQHFGLEATIDVYGVFVMLLSLSVLVSVLRRPVAAH